MNQVQLLEILADMEAKGMRYSAMLVAQHDKEQREAVARVEAERDALKVENAELAGSIELEDASNHYREQQLKAQLDEAVGLLLDASDPKGPCIRYAAIKDFLLRYAAMPDMTAEQSAAISRRTREAYVAQAEQQEVPKRGKPDWSSHGYDQIFQTSDGNWFGARAGWDFKGHISDGWKGREVSLLRDDGGFLAYGEQNPDWENSLEQRPVQEAQGAQAGEFQREDRYIVIKRKDWLAVQNSTLPFADDAAAGLWLALRRIQPFLPKRDYLVIESDWPEYEPTWAAIQARVTGQPAAAHGDKPK